MHPTVAVLQFTAPVGSVIVSDGVPPCVVNSRLMVPWCAAVHPASVVCPRQNTSVTVMVFPEFAVIVFVPRLSWRRSINGEDVFSTVYVNCESMVWVPPLASDQVAFVPRPPGVVNCAVVSAVVPPPKISIEAVSGSAVPTEFDGPAPAVKLRKFLSVSMHPFVMPVPNVLIGVAPTGQLVSVAHPKLAQSDNNTAGNSALRACPAFLR